MKASDAENVSFSHSTVALVLLLTRPFSQSRTYRLPINLLKAENGAVGLTQGSHQMRLGNITMSSQSNGWALGAYLQ